MMVLTRTRSSIHFGLSGLRSSVATRFGVAAAPHSTTASPFATLSHNNTTASHHPLPSANQHYQRRQRSQRSSSTPSYVLGSEQRELVRLGVQHGVFAAESRKLYRRAGITLGDTVIDAGCGPGFSSLEIAQIVGTEGTVYCMDGSADALAMLSRRAEDQGWWSTTSATTPTRTTTTLAPAPPATAAPETHNDGNRTTGSTTTSTSTSTNKNSTIETKTIRMEHSDFGALVLVQGDVSSDKSWQHVLNNTGNNDGVVSSSISSSNGKVDKVWCRWLLTWLQHGDVEKVLSHAGNATKTGGKIMVWDYFNEQTFDIRSSLASGAPCWQLVKDTLMDEWHAVGDPSVCAKVPELLTRFNFVVEDIAPLAPIIRAGSVEWVWPSTYFKTQAKRLVESGAIQYDANPMTHVNAAGAQRGGDGDSIGCKKESTTKEGGEPGNRTFLERFEYEWQLVSQDTAAWYAPPMMAMVVAQKI